MTIASYQILCSHIYFIKKDCQTKLTLYLFELRIFFKIFKPSFFISKSECINLIVLN